MTPSTTGHPRPNALRPHPEKDKGTPRSAWTSAAVQALAAFSITGAWYFVTWQKLTTSFQPNQSYYRATAPSVTLVASLLVSLLAVAAVLFCTFRLAWKRSLLSEERLIRGAGALTLVCVLVRSPIVQTSYILVLAVLIAAIGALFAARRVLSQLAMPLVIMASVLFLIQAVSCAWNYARLPSDLDLSNGEMLPTITGTESKAHIIWIVFDELDYELSTDLRPASVEMPNFDRLRRESISASDAHSPADWTSISFPSFFMGKRLFWVHPEGPNDLYVWAEGEKPVLWRNQPTLLSYAREKGLNSAIAGWYHPYCRMFNSTVADCFWTPSVDAFNSLRNEFALQKTGLGVIWPGRDVVPISQEYALIAREHQQEFRDTMGHALEILANRKMNLIILHMLIPHPPGIYDRSSNRMESRPGSNYLDNLELVDVALGEMRRTLEREGLWDESAVIVTGDHALRRNVWSPRPIWTAEEEQLTGQRTDPRVPLLIKVPHADRPAVYDKPMDVVLIHDLTMQWIDGKNLTPNAVATYLDENRLRFPVHVARKTPGVPTADQLPD